MNKQRSRVYQARTSLPLHTPPNHRIYADTAVTWTNISISSHIDSYVYIVRIIYSDNSERFPRIKYHMVKVPQLWDLSPPPSQNKSHMLSQYYIWNMCWRKFAIEGGGGAMPWDFFRGGGGLPYGIIPPGEVMLWVFFRGKVCHMIFLHGERLPNGIISTGQSPMVFFPLSWNLWGGGGGDSQLTI